MKKSDNSLDGMMINISPLNMKVIVKNKLDEDEDEDEVQGLTEITDEEIHIRKDLSETYKKITLLHEIIHVILYRCGNNSPHKNHEVFIDGIAYGMLNVLKDNPELMKYLFGDTYNISNKK